jgi:hypothetical protein
MMMTTQQQAEWSQWDSSERTERTQQDYNNNRVAMPTSQLPPLHFSWGQGSSLSSPVYNYLIHKSCHCLS